MSSGNLPHINGDTALDEIEMSERREALTLEAIHMMIVTHHRQSIEMQRATDKKIDDQTGRIIELGKSVQTVSNRQLQIQEGMRKRQPATGQTEIVIVPKAVPVWIAAALLLGVLITLYLTR